MRSLSQAARRGCPTVRGTKSRTLGWPDKRGLHGRTGAHQLDHPVATDEMLDRGTVAPVVGHPDVPRLVHLDGGLVLEPAVCEPAVARRDRIAGLRPRRAV